MTALNANNGYYIESTPDEREDWLTTGTQPWAYALTASEESVKTVLAANKDDEEGRSQWLWFRLPNGDLILGVFPQGETYFATEKDHSRPVNGGKQRGRREQ